MRVLKDPEVRRAEILDVAEQLFTTKGYAKTTVMDILGAVGIAKGTFYYYFKSKEEVMEAVIDRMVEQDVRAAKKITARTDLTPVEKLFQVLTAQQPVHGEKKSKMLEQFHQSGNAEMHQRSLAVGIRSMAPILEEIVREGCGQGLFATDYPKETMELLMAAGQLMFDEGLFQWTQEEQREKAVAFVCLAEKALGAPKGSFGFMEPLLLGDAAEQ